MLAQLRGEDVSWANQNTIHPLAVVAVIAAGLIIVQCKRSWAAVAILAMVCFVSSAQRIVIAGLDFGILRVLVLLVLARILIRDELRSPKWNGLDLAMLLWAAVSTITYTIQVGAIDGLIFRLGTSVEYLGIYFAFRFLLRSPEEVIDFARAAAIIVMPVALVLLLEKSTGRNMFAVFGGVPETTLVRNGRIRAQGAFPHAILTGVFFSTLWPLVTTLWTVAGQRVLPILATVATGLVVVACASSTPVGVFGAAVLTFALWPFRRHLKTLTWCAIAGLVCLHFLMEAPVWHLLARLDIVGGSTGYHRYLLIDNAIAHLGEWWLVGTRSTAHWGHSQDDVANHFILEGVRGGLPTMVMFIVVVVVAFLSFGRFRTAARLDGDTAGETVAFALAVCLFAHCVAFFGVSYFGQISLVLFGQLGIGSSLLSLARQRERNLDDFELDCDFEETGEATPTQWPGQAGGCHCGAALPSASAHA